MASVFAILLAVVLGCALAARFANLTSLRPRWAAALVIVGAGAAVGIGLTSILFLLALLLIPASPGVAMWIEMAALAWLAYDLFRRRNNLAPATEPAPKFPSNAVLMAALSLALVLVMSAMNGSWESNPQGNWDAWAIWNVRAKFLTAGGDLAQRAWSPLLKETHPEYPLLTSSFVARTWTYTGSISTAAPITVSVVFFLALIAMATGGMAAWRSGPLGLLLGFTLAATPTLLHVVPDQYADVPLACYFAGALILALLDRPVLAGLLAGLAAWTKDEGLLFAIVFLAAAAVFRRSQVSKLLAGAAPGLAIAVLFKAILARGTESLLGTSMPVWVQHISDPSRYLQTISAMGPGFVGMAYGWYHPILPVIVLAIALRFDARQKRDALFCGTVALLLLAGYFAIYIVAPYDLAWQLRTSLSRLYIQLWPVLLIAIWASLRTPEATAIVETQSLKARKKAKA